MFQKTNLSNFYKSVYMCSTASYAMKILTSHTVFSFLFIIFKLTCLSTASIENETCTREIEFRRMCPPPIHSSRSQRRNSLQKLDIFISLAYTNENSAQVPGCNFYNNSKARVEGVHITEKPWDFSTSQECQHTVTFLKKADSSWVTSPICRHEIGTRLRRIGHVKPSNVSVYLWHNFTLFQDRIQFKDKITNYNLSTEGIACSRLQKFVQLVIVTAIGTACRLIVQQYNIDLKNLGCDYTNFHDHPFCGVYNCSQSYRIIEDLKLIRKPVRYTEVIEQDKKEESPEETVVIKHKVEPTDAISETIETTTSEPHIETMSLGEVIITAGFPIGGLLLILFGLCCLREQYARYKYK